MDKNRDISRAIGKIIVYERSIRGLTAGELAEKIGVSRAAMSRIENGGRDLRIEIAQKLFEIGIDLSDYLANYIISGKVPEIPRT